MLRKQRLSRNLQLNQLAENINKTHLRYAIYTDCLTKCMETITNTILKSTKKIRKIKHKKWFDLECKNLKQKCLVAMKNGDQNYNQIRKSYKSTIIVRKMTTLKKNCSKNILVKQFRTRNNVSFIYTDDHI